MKNAFAIAIVVLLCECSSSNSSYVNTTTYNDIEAFVQAEIARMDSQAISLLRFTNWNGISTTDTAIEVDWKNELALFADVKIPKAVWRTDFELIDSSNNQGQIIRSLGALQPNQEVRLLRITTNKRNEIKRLEVEMRSLSRLSNSKRKMSYTVDKGYTIVGNRQTKFLKEENYKIVCQILNGQ